MGKPAMIHNKNCDPDTKKNSGRKIWDGKGKKKQCKILFTAILRRYVQPQENYRKLEIKPQGTKGREHCSVFGWFQRLLKITVLKGKDIIEVLKYINHENNAPSYCLNFVIYAFWHLVFGTLSYISKLDIWQEHSR